MLSNLKSKLEYTLRNISLVTDLLKFQMGIDIDEPIELKDNLNTLINLAVASNLIDKQFDVNTNFDYKIVKTSEQLQRQTLKVDQAKYYPTMNMFLSYTIECSKKQIRFFK